MAIVALSYCAGPHAKAATDVSIDFFYDNLGDDGNWIEVGDYGYCWQPNVAVSDRSWRPYADGYWAYTDVGWTWVSYENFGWATYHYGRWARLRGTGWVWVPGTEWGPAWVSWRTGGDHVGWAPLPPRYEGGEPVYEGRPITSRVDIEFDIGPECYNFVDVRYIGEPVLRRRIVDSRENITYIDNTVNVTNITYNNSVVYNYGPDYNRLSAYSTREIPRLQLQREQNVDLGAAARSNAMTKVQGNQLMIAAPVKLERSAETVAPKIVKTKIEKANVETGWSGIDQKRRADLQAKFKTENPKEIAPPRVQPVRPDELKKAATALQASPAPGVSPASGDMAGQGKLTREQMKQQAEAQAAARKAQMQQENDAKKAAQSQQAEQLKQQTETKKAERDQQAKQAQEAALARKAQMGQATDAKRAAQSQQAEQLKQQADTKRAEREQQVKQAEDAAAGRRVQMQQENESRRAAQIEQMKQAQEAANARKVQMQQENDARRGAQAEQLQQQAEARRAAREQQAQKVQQMQQAAPQQPEGNPGQKQDKKPKKGQTPPAQTPAPEQ